MGSKLFQALADGVLGGVYGPMAVGLTLIFGVPGQKRRAAARGADPLQSPAGSGVPGTGSVR